MGTPEVVVAVNKMDAVGCDEAVFRELADAIGAAAATVGVRALAVVPISALEGDGILSRSAKAPWFSGPCLAEALAGLAPDRAAAAPAVVPLQGVLKVAGGRRYTARVAAGTLRRGMSLTTFPHGGMAVLRGIYRGFQAVEAAAADAAVALDVDGDFDLDRGDALLAPELGGAGVKQLACTLFWLDAAPFDPARPLSLRHLTSETRVVVERVEAGYDLQTLATGPAPAMIGPNAIVRASLKLARPLPVKNHRDLPQLGRFVLFDQVSKATVAAGIVG
jgi:sulfate adenylyltransferase subunit 1 (EFTu-like GTPase family)